jgi:hypothetical protein
VNCKFSEGLFEKYRHISGSHMTSIEKIIEETLKSLDNIKRATASPFFFTRLESRLNDMKPRLWERVICLASTPKMAFLLIVGVILINVSAILFSDLTNLGGVNNSEHKFSTEYDIATNGFYDIENLDSDEGK